jgi:glycosyltransferase involved in cell wall biosynthesis
MDDRLKNDIFCVIPAFNEEASIEKVVINVKKIIDNVVVVDDGSSDMTAEIAKKNGAFVLRHFINRGQGAALQTGNEYCLKNGAAIIVHFDADDQFLYTDIKEVIKPLLSGACDIVFGSRFLDKSLNNNIPFLKRAIIFPLARLVNKIFVGIALSDPQNGFRAMTSEAAKKIDIRNDGMAHNSEIQYKAFRYNLSVGEVPVTVKYNKFGQSLFGGRGRASGGIRIVIDLLLSRIMN